MFTSKGQFVTPPLPGISGIWQCLQTFLVVTTWGVGATGSWVGRGQGCCNERDRLPQQRSILFQVSTVLKLRTPTLSYYIFHLLFWFGEAALQADQDAHFSFPSYSSTYSSSTSPIHSSIISAQAQSTVLCCLSPSSSH